MTSETEIKSKGSIRWEAVIPFLIVATVIYVYTHFFFDRHLKKSFEWLGYQIIGAEVNVSNVKTSFFQGTFQVRGIQITNPDKPSNNLIEIGDIRFGILWDGLLRARFVVEEMALEKIEIGTQRQRIGKVKPPEPPKPKKEGPSVLEKEALKLKDKALSKTKEEYSGNVLGDIASMLSGTSTQDQLHTIEGSLPSKAKLTEFDKALKEKQNQWSERLKSLPQAKEIQVLGEKLSKVKTKDFKTPQEVQQSIDQIKTILDEADAKIKNIQKTGQDLNADIKTVDAQFKEIEGLVKKDIKDLETRFRLPKLDAKSLSVALFKQYLNPYLAKFNHYKNLADKYVPPNLMKKDKKDEVDVSIQPHPRTKGVTYEFGRPNSYPVFWIKKISVSSKAGASANSGDVAGLVSNITSNQALIGKPTTVELKGSFPGMEITDVFTKLAIDNTKKDSLISFDFKMGSYPLAEHKLIESSDVQIGFNKAYGSLSTKGELIGLQDFKFKMTNNISKIDYKVSAKNEVIDSVIKNVFSGIPVVTMEATGEGELPSDVALDIRSNLGEELQKGFEAQLKKKIEEAKAKLQAYVDEQIGKEKAKIEAEIQKFKTQIDNEIKKAQDLVNKEKQKAEQQANAAKKDAENSAKKQAQDQIKKAIGPDGEKKLEDLKKKFGL